MEFWRLLAKPVRQRSLTVKLMREVDSGLFLVPKAFEVLARYPSEQASLSPPEPRRVELPELPLTRRFLAKYPEAKAEPLALDSFQAPLSRRFAQRQLQLIQGGATPAAAFAQTEQEMADQLRQLKGRHVASAGVSPLDLLQQQEQEQLDAGISALSSGGPSGHDR